MPAARAAVRGTRTPGSGWAGYPYAGGSVGAGSGVDAGDCIGAGPGICAGGKSAPGIPAIVGWSCTDGGPDTPGVACGLPSSTAGRSGGAHGSLGSGLWSVMRRPLSYGHAKRCRRQSRSCLR